MDEKEKKKYDELRKELVLNIRLAIITRMAKELKATLVSLGI